MTTKLERVGAKLDAADIANADGCLGLCDDYEALATARALKVRPPRLAIKTVADYWSASELLLSITHRADALRADLANPNRYDLRANVDVKVAYALATRDAMVVRAAIIEYKAKKEAKREAKREAWREARRTVKIPERDRIPQR